MGVGRGCPLKFKKEYHSSVNSDADSKSVLEIKNLVIYIYATLGGGGVLILFYTHIHIHTHTDTQIEL